VQPGQNRKSLSNSPSTNLQTLDSQQNISAVAIIKPKNLRPESIEEGVEY
jgi:hypothetical protein